MAETKVEQISYGGWSHCYRLSNGTVELVITTDVGPRIIRYGFIGAPNMFVEFADQLGQAGESWWVMRGGHRLWIAPEVVPDTYALDNAPVEIIIEDGVVCLLQPVEPETGLQKQLAVQLSSDGGVSVVHTIRNAAARPRRIAAWALTQMAPGGVAIAPFPPRGCHEDCLQPTNPLVMWAYTDFADKRWLLTKSYLILKQDPINPSPQKAGLFHPRTRMAYLLADHLFVKRSEADPTVPYPDFQSSLELFTNGGCLELETLGPLLDLEPGASTSHVEDWSLYRGVNLPALSEAAIDQAILPLLG
jgi:hypothetical protein